MSIREKQERPWEMWLCWGWGWDEALVLSHAECLEEFGEFRAAGAAKCWELGFSSQGLHLEC